LIVPLTSSVSGATADSLQCGVVVLTYVENGFDCYDIITYHDLYGPISEITHKRPQSQGQKTWRLVATNARVDTNQLVRFQLLRNKFYMIKSRSADLDTMTLEDVHSRNSNRLEVVLRNLDKIDKYVVVDTISKTWPVIQWGGTLKITLDLSKLEYDLKISLAQVKNDEELSRGFFYMKRTDLNSDFKIYYTIGDNFFPK
jgi:hypothetical protein